MELPTILGGPIVRRVESAGVFIWIALSKPFDIGAELFKVNRDNSSRPFEYERVECRTDTKTIQAGKHLYISLVKISPRAGGFFPTNTLLGYNLLFENSMEKQDLGSYDLLSSNNPESIVYGDLAYPTFYINEGNHSPILYGSCRKLHGEGTDVFAEADKTIAAAFDHAERPSSLFLTGDQIYADDVADPIIKVITKFSKELIGQEEDFTSVDPRLKDEPFNKEFIR